MKIKCKHSARIDCKTLLCTVRAITRTIYRTGALKKKKRRKKVYGFSDLGRSVEMKTTVRGTSVASASVLSSDNKKIQKCEIINYIYLQACRVVFPPNVENGR